MLASLLLLASVAHADTLVVSWSYVGIVEGYDHDHRVDVFVEGRKVAESRVAPESEPGKLKVALPDGGCHVRIVDNALYEGEWQEHTVENDYSLDALWEGDLPAKKKHKIRLVFDIGAMETRATVK
jgi:hypothetical protein